MVLEVAVLQIKEGMARNLKILLQMHKKSFPPWTGIFQEIQECVERKDQYILPVKWETRKDHEVGFRKSAEYQEWKRMLHHFYDPFPVVEHYVKL